MHFKEIIINSNINEIRIAIFENNNVAEILIERAKNKNIIGNIYKGVVKKILPGLQSAFINIGLPKAAFLHVSDITTGIKDCTTITANNFSTLIEEDLEFIDENQVVESTTKPIEDIINKNQEIIVQVSKEPINQKGARITTYITIPGRYLVFMPDYNHVGVSRKIGDADEIQRLKVILSDIKPENAGLIARTVSAGVNKQELEKDLAYLIKTWHNTLKNIKRKKIPTLLYEEPSLLVRTLRDILSKDVDKLVIDNKEDYTKIKKFISEFLPGFDINLELYDGDLPIFDHYNIEVDINRLSDNKIWLKSGGYIVIDQCEALTAIDVNTGKYTGKRNFDQTILKTNLEASKEIAYQLRLRNIGGIIIIDFIDMKIEEHKEKILKTLEEEFKHDRHQVTVVDITPLGLVEITRKRTQDSIVKIMSEPCPYCEGKGRIRSKISVCYDIIREIEKEAKLHRKSTISVKANPEIVKIILNYEKEYVVDLENKYDLSVVIKSNDDSHHEYYNVE